MGRRLIVKVGDIYKRRNQFWASHYEARNLIKCMPFDKDYVIGVLKAELPKPVLDVDGDVIENPINVRMGENRLKERLKLPMAVLFNPLVCWYWSEVDWMEFVRLFQSLPEPTEDYYYLYDVESDVARLVPMSSKSKKGSVDKSVDNSGTTRRFQVQVLSKVG